MPAGKLLLGATLVEEGSLAGSSARLGMASGEMDMFALATMFSKSGQDR
jgi:hypothetical protein